MRCAFFLPMKFCVCSPFTLGRRTGRSTPLMTQKPPFGHSLKQRVEIGGRSDGQEQLAAQHPFDPGSEPLDPPAGMRLAQANEQGQHFLQRAALELSIYPQVLWQIGE